MRLGFFSADPDSPRGGAPLPTSGVDLLDAVRATIGRHGLLERGDRVVVAVSGGPDSVALLHALTLLSGEYALELAACHVHHGLRAEADRDAEFVRALAGRLGCPVTVERVAVPLGAGRSPEEAARAVRYAALRRAARAAGATRIALGHTADDQAETVLMRVLQGAGPRGLAGIPVRRGELIRPLLEMNRAAVLAHLEAHGLPCVEDATNRDTKLLRNRIRHEVLPLLAAHGWPRIREALRRTARASREAVDALEVLLTPRLADIVRPAMGGVALSLDALRDLPPGAAKAVFARVIGKVRAQHLDRVYGLMVAPVGARIRLPGGTGVERARDTLWILWPPASSAILPLEAAGETEVPGLGVRLRVELSPPGETPPANPWDAWFDATALPGALVVRPCCPGDRIVPFGEASPVRVSRLLAAAGTAPSVRRRWPLLVAAGADGETVLWVIGVRRAAAAAVTAETSAVLRVRGIPASWQPAREESP